MKIHPTCNAKPTKDFKRMNLIELLQYRPKTDHHVSHIGSVQGHTVNKWWCWDSETHPSDSMHVTSSSYPCHRRVKMNVAVTANKKWVWEERRENQEGWEQTAMDRNQKN